ncbi:DUF4177 domain-containing protein [Thalassovita aquimarina]|uniref:DUF4177 domain-containing protein n=1 Tax=Thalassovita aquimarina TaxID=2785917 RepID=A0ABS5HQM7_9RHOB|nr:DUF4177 domain-containing protein [Thalassovita aquimarina]MBR9651218.1 DUF4177 domain-containing protein [Thalassovita aquimarina]
MTIYDYKVVPAPTKGARARGLKGPGARLGHSFETLLNDMAGDGWEFQRAETLPSEERQGLTHSSTTFRTFLVFRRPRRGDIDAFAPRPPEGAEMAPDARQNLSDPAASREEEGAASQSGET